MKPVSKRQMELFSRGLMQDENGWVEFYCGHHKSGAYMYYQDGIVRLKCKACYKVIVDLQLAEDVKIVVPAKTIIS